jgi:hypothetical protein
MKGVKGTVAYSPLLLLFFSFSQHQILSMARMLC